MTQGKGIVYLVGAGPGDPGLITARGLDLIRRADVIVHDRIIGYELLADAKADAVILNAGKKPGEHRGKQDELNRMMIDHAGNGAMVVRLKGGDPFVFGRGFEEMTACREAGIDCVVVPGVTSAFAVPAVAGVPITSRHLVRSIAVVSARAARDSTAPPLDFSALARIDTISILMGRSSFSEFARNLIDAGRDPKTPAAGIEWGTTHKQRVTKATLDGIADACEKEDLHAPIVFVVGEAADCAIADFNGSSAVLAGKTVLIPHRLSPANPLRRRLSAAGATVLACDLVQASVPDSFDDLDRALGEVDSYDWIAFDSPVAVRFFFDRLLWSGRDVRALAACKVAVFGRAARRALIRRGLRANLVYESRSPGAEEMNGLHALRDASVLCPCAEAPDGTLRELFRSEGVRLIEVACYRDGKRVLPAPLRERMREGVDAAVLTNADTVRCFLNAVPDAQSIPVVCTCHEAARLAEALGLSVGEVVPTNRSRDVFRGITALLDGEGTGHGRAPEKTAPLQVP